MNTHICLECYGEVFSSKKKVFEGEGALTKPEALPEEVLPVEDETK